MTAKALSSACNQHPMELSGLLPAPWILFSPTYLCAIIKKSACMFICICVCVAIYIYISYLAKNVPDHIFSAWWTGDRADVSVILAGIFS